MAIRGVCRSLKSSSNQSASVDKNTKDIDTDNNAVEFPIAEKEVRNLVEYVKAKTTRRHEYNFIVEINIVKCMEFRLQELMKNNKLLTRFSARKAIMNMIGTGVASPFGFDNSKNQYSLSILLFGNW